MDVFNRQPEPAPAVTAAAISLLFAEVGCQMSNETAYLQRAGAIGWADRVQCAACRCVVWQQFGQATFGDIFLDQVSCAQQDPGTGTGCIATQHGVVHLEPAEDRYLRISVRP